MIRALTATSLIAFVLSGSALYSRSNKTVSLQQKIDALRQQRQDSIDHTKLLCMKWSLLNQPERLEQLSHKFLPHLRPSSAVQYASLNSRDLDKVLASASDNGRVELAQNTRTYKAPIIQASVSGRGVRAQSLNYKVPSHSIALAVHKHSSKDAGLIKLASYKVSNSPLPAPTPFE